MAKRKGARKSAKRSSTRKVGSRGTDADRCAKILGTAGARRGARGGAAAAAPAIQGWPTDPMGGVPPLHLPVPACPEHRCPRASSLQQGRRLPRYIRSEPTGSATGRPPRRCVASAAFWSAAGARGWHPDVGASIPVRLDDGVDLNAYYARNDFPPEDIKQGLSFFHDTVRDVGHRPADHGVLGRESRRRRPRARSRGARQPEAGAVRARLDRSRGVSRVVRGYERDPHGAAAAVRAAGGARGDRRKPATQFVGVARRRAAWVCDSATQSRGGRSRQSPQRGERVRLRGSADVAVHRPGHPVDARGSQLLARVHRRISRSAWRHGDATRAPARALTTFSRPASTWGGSSRRQPRQHR